jgi:hypothetical protein
LQTPAPTNAESAYLASACERLHDALGEWLVGVYVGGSYALGDYLPGRSDLDLAGVVRSSLPSELVDEVVARLRHEALPCPARRLELVLYQIETARSGSAAWEFELNLNTGATTPLSVQSKGDAEEVGSHWFPIDRSILSQAGLALHGPPAGEVFTAILRAALLPALAQSVRWHRGGESEPSDAVLNACRALRFAQEGQWSSKPAAGRWATEHGLAPRKLVEDACRARALAAQIDPEDVAAFLLSVESRLSRWS